MVYRSYKDISIAIFNGLAKLRHQYDLIVGIPRSGMIPATILSMYMHAQLASLDEFCKGQLMSVGLTRFENYAVKSIDTMQHVLVIDDSICSGRSMLDAKMKIQSSSALKHMKLTIDFAAVYSNEKKASQVDFYFEHLPCPRCFQWNIFQNKKTCINALYDIDGVICRDPSNEENDDGSRYLEFIRTAKQKLPIRFTVGGFCSSRLEKYRTSTEAWLNANGYKYNNLFLLNLNSKEERLRLKAHAPFKAGIYKNRPERLFVESSLDQAKEIARLAKKDVFCTQNMEYIYGNQQ